MPISYYVKWCIRNDKSFNDDVYSNPLIPSLSLTEHISYVTRSFLCFLVSNPKRPTEYSADVYNQMPIKKLLLVSRENQSLYEDIYPPLLRLVIKNYPHLCLVEDYMFEEEIKKESASSIVAARSSGSLHKDKICTPDELHSG